MTNGQKQKMINQYVEETCNAFLTAYKDITKVEYRCDDTQNSFIKVTTAFGFSNYYDVTDLDCGDICRMLCSVVCSGKPTNQLKDLELIRLVEKLFK